MHDYVLKLMIIMPSPLLVANALREIENPDSCPGVDLMLH